MLPPDGPHPVAHLAPAGIQGEAPQQRRGPPPQHSLGRQALTAGGLGQVARGRGLATTLKRAQVAWAVEHGLETLETTNELRNAPMRRVNQKLGYTPAPGRIHLRGPVASAAKI